MKEQVEEILKKNIYEWVKKNFGQSEADDPSWDIDALAHGLTYGSHSALKYDIYRAVEREFLREDCDMVAEQENIKLDEKEREAVIDDFMDSEAYVDCPKQDWLYFMHKVKGDYDN